MDEYIIINKTAIQKRVEELEKTEEDKTNQLRAIEYSENPEHFDEIEILEKELSGLENSIEELKQILSQSTPLIPEIEKALYSKGAWYEDEIQGYISNLKLGI